MTYFDDNDRLPIWMLLIHPGMLLVYVLALWLFGVIC
jgi:hypothetical protein